MAVIALKGTSFDYAMGMGVFDGLSMAFSDAKRTTSTLHDALSTLKSKIDVAATAASVDTSQTQAQQAQARESTKKSSLTLAYEKLDALISDTGRVDQRASSKISSREDDFYKRYYYLKPECKKTNKEKRDDWWAERWQNFKDFWGGVGNAIANIAHNVCEWCKEHWVAIVTALAVIAVALVAVLVFGVEVLVVAAVAALVSLVLSVVDIGFLLITGKDAGDFLREKGLNTLGDIVDGLSWGCDFVAIVFPLASFVKQSAQYITKFGLKQFLSSTKQSFKLSIKATWNKLFRSGWKDGMKNAFKIFIYDFDDLKRSNTTLKLVNSGQWVSDGTKLVPKVGTKNYDDCMRVLTEFGLDGIPIDKFGNPDAYALNKFVFKDAFPDGITVDISDFSDVRGSKYVMYPKSGTTNFSQANQMLQSKYNVSLSQLEDMFGFSLTWHEDLNLKTLIPLPTVLHGPSTSQVSHTGGISIFKFMFPRTTNMVNNFIKVEVPNTISSLYEYFRDLAPTN